MAIINALKISNVELWQYVESGKQSLKRAVDSKQTLESAATSITPETVKVASLNDPAIDIHYARIMLERLGIPESMNDEDVIIELTKRIFGFKLDLKII